MTLDDLIARQRSLIPGNWVPPEAPVLTGLLAGFSNSMLRVYGLIQYVGLQAHILTATDGWLDVAALDFFGLRFKRKPGQTDSSFRLGIIAEIFRERATRRGIQKAVQDLTGQQVRMFEPFNPRDTGGWDTGYLGFDMTGRWGDISHPRDILIATLNPIGAGIPSVGGYDNGIGGLDTPQTEWGDQSQVTGPVTQQDIYDTINATRAAGINAWVAIGYPPEGQLDSTFALDQSGVV